MVPRAGFARTPPGLTAPVPGTSSPSSPTAPPCAPAWTRPRPTRSATSPARPSTRSGTDRATSSYARTSPRTSTAPRSAGAAPTASRTLRRPARPPGWPGLGRCSSSPTRAATWHAPAVTARASRGPARRCRWTSTPTAGIIDALSPDLAYMEFHLGGENWMHRQRRRDGALLQGPEPRGGGPHLHERPLLPHRRAGPPWRSTSGLDCIIFSVDGATQESYEKYRVRGNASSAA